MSSPTLINIARTSWCLHKFNHHGMKGCSKNKALIGSRIIKLLNPQLVVHGARYLSGIMHHLFCICLKSGSLFKLLNMVLKPPPSALNIERSTKWEATILASQEHVQHSNPDRSQKYFLIWYHWTLLHLQCFASECYSCIRVHHLTTLNIVTLCLQLVLSKTIRIGDIKC